MQTIVKELNLFVEQSDLKIVSCARRILLIEQPRKEWMIFNYARFYDFSARREH